MEYWKERSPSISTDAGMQIEESDKQEQNAPDSIRESLEPSSNVTLQSFMHDSKQYSPSISTDPGMQIEESDEQE
jgi:hypothetical protein